MIVMETNSFTYTQWRRYWRHFMCLLFVDPHKVLKKNSKTTERAKDHQNWSLIICSLNQMEVFLSVFQFQTYNFNARFEDIKRPEMDNQARLWNSSFEHLSSILDWCIRILTSIGKLFYHLWLYYRTVLILHLYKFI